MNVCTVVGQEVAFLNNNQVQNICKVFRNTPPYRPALGLKGVFWKKAVGSVEKFKFPQCVVPRSFGLYYYRHNNFQSI